MLPSSAIFCSTEPHIEVCCVKDCLCETRQDILWCFKRYVSLSLYITHMISGTIRICLYALRHCRDMPGSGSFNYLNTNILQDTVTCRRIRAITTIVGEKHYTFRAYRVINVEVYILSRVICLKIKLLLSIEYSFISHYWVNIAQSWYPIP